jgi:F-type H+-transporting ATPase subunit epsilon
MNLEVVTPTGTAVSTDADEVTVPGAFGELGVLPGHTPLMAALRAGVLAWKKGTQRGLVAVGAGFVEVSGKDRIVALVQSSARPDDIDQAATQAELDEADRTLKEWKPDAAGPTRGEVESRRAWAQARLDARARR